MPHRGYTTELQLQQAGQLLHSNDGNKQLWVVDVAWAVEHIKNWHRIQMTTEHRATSSPVREIDKNDGCHT